MRRSPPPSSALAVAQNDADRKKAAAELVAANQRKIDARNAKAAADKALWEKERKRIVDVTHCTGTAVGCLKH